MPHGDHRSVAISSEPPGPTARWIHPPPVRRVPRRARAHDVPAGRPTGQGRGPGRQKCPCKHALALEIYTPLALKYPPQQARRLCCVAHAHWQPEAQAPQVAGRRPAGRGVHSCNLNTAAGVCSSCVLGGPQLMLTGSGRPEAAPRPGRRPPPSRPGWSELQVQVEASKNLTPGSELAGKLGLQAPSLRSSAGTGVAQCGCTCELRS